MQETTQDFALSAAVKQVVKIAQAIAKENGHAAFAPAHLLKALLHEDAGLLPLLGTLGQSIPFLDEWADVRIESLPKAAAFQSRIAGSASAVSAMDEADVLRVKLGREAIEPLHLLAALSTPGVGFTYEQLKSFPLRREDLLARSASDDEMHAALDGHPNANPNGQNPKSGQHALVKYCIDKTLLARAGKLDNIVGRDREVRMMAEILCRRSKPNVLLVGEPGVGKSALADGFALAILQEQVPPPLSGARVFELDSGALVAGASYKGEVEERLKNIIAEIKQFDRAILFIDELHTLLDKHGAAAGSANLLKPQLARGELTVIGATTLEEYRKYIEPDRAFSRRFEVLPVEEPPSETCFHMIKAVIPYYEQHHHLAVPDEAIHESIRYAKRYVKDRKLPDAAIDLLDCTLAALQLSNESGPKNATEALGKYTEWCRDEPVRPRSLEAWRWFCQQVRQQVSPVLWARVQPEGDPAEMTRVDDLKAYLHGVLEALRVATLTPRTSLENTDLAAMIANKTGIPTGQVQAQERERLLEMESRLKQRVVGQDHAIQALSAAVIESRAGLSKPGQPIGSFFFLGPTGTGKTELAKSLAEFLFQDESAIIRFDMSEFKEEHAVAGLYGAPPGYVGYEEGGLLINKIRQHPYAVVLFDEIEKAHPAVFDLFLQIMDEGRLHDKLGKEGDFSNALIIFTSNCESQYIAGEFAKGHVPAVSTLLEKMAQRFRPEFLGRLTEIIPFAPLTRPMVQNILRIQLKNVHQALQKQSIQLVVSADALDVLAQRGFSPTYGARPLAGVIRSEVRRPISRSIISGAVKPGDRVELVTGNEGSLEWHISNQSGNEK